ncbi:MAG TPA: heavy-metal-associated domain-containing protein [Polyangiaceae bacterium]|nr:heavy-metal-associated domain-containing protein [Polyangiaceae bacterium]
MPSESRAQRLSLAGAVLSAVAASSCCLGPLLLAALGVGGAGAFATLAAFRPYILGVTAALLAAGFYLTYRRPRAASADACGCERRTTRRAGRVGLWLAAALVLLFAASPTLLARALDRPAKAAPSGVRTETVTFDVKGIDCEACAVPLRRALAKVGGFHALSLDVPGQTAAVLYEPAPGRLEAYVAAIDELGYEAAVRGAATR